MFAHVEDRMTLPNDTERLVHRIAFMATVGMFSEIP